VRRNRDSFSATVSIRSATGGAGGFETEEPAFDAGDPRAIRMGGRKQEGTRREVEARGQRQAVFGCLRMPGALARVGVVFVEHERHASVGDTCVQQLRIGHGEGLAGTIVDPVYPLVIVEIDGFRATSENALEAIVVADVAARLRERMLDASGSPYRSDAAFWSDGLFIVSPHHAHIGAIRRRLAKKRAWTSPPFVGTVDKMQGQECDAVIASYGVADVEYALVEQEFIYSLNRLNVSITRGRAKTIVLLSKALTNPPIQAFAKEENAAGIGFMQGLVQFAEENGSVRRYTWKDGAKLRVIRVPAST
jgi:hypothetical protein